MHVKGNSVSSTGSTVNQIGIIENPENDPFGVEIYYSSNSAQQQQLDSFDPSQLYQTEVPEWPSLQSSRSGETTAKCCAAALPVHLLLAL
jgi:hypothetical protein